jgi:hypothetical protein
VKEFLAVRGIAFESINVLEDEGGMDKLRALGARTIPIVAKGGKFVFAQVIKDVVEFLELNEDTGPKLSPAQLAARYDRVLTAAVSSVRQMPDSALGKELPNRPRSYLVLMHHMFQIPVEFLDSLAENRVLAYEKLVEAPPAAMTSSDAVADFGQAMHQRFNVWWQDEGQKLDYSQPFEAYFGTTTLHEMLERTVWHSTQHVRQVQNLLEQQGVTPSDKLGLDVIDGLPLTEKVWDE